MYVIVDKFGSYWDDDNEEWIDGIITEGCIYYTVGRAKTDISDHNFQNCKVMEITLKDVN